jgi:hypothetical protein
MLELWNRLSLGLFDALLGWLLQLSPHLLLCAVALGSAVLLTLVRRFTTNQDLLLRIAADKKRLAVLLGEAKRRRHAEEVKRLRAVKSMVLFKSLRQEVLPLLVSILPIALLATWCLARLEFHPPRGGESIPLVAYMPVSRAGDLIHIVPQPGLGAEGGWIQRLRAVTDEGPPYATATWILRGEPSEEPYRIQIRLEGTTLDQELSIGRWIYSSPLISHRGQVVTELRMRPFKLFNLIPGIPAIYLAPWLVAYLLLVIPLVPVTRRMLRVY